ncbi:MAG: hypothetical protein CMG74_09450 [Candidatus Marinimicrobia bacterium]|nr:hypothetical protein [Candidatus Neomarinimicrobiota bacterium]|tara:strand:+ start:11781 stop:12548 length:768 start_codon:yes stop_codon:yes gene_type:complete
MGTDNSQIQQMAEKLIEARSNKKPMLPLSEKYNLSMNDAYRVQKIIIDSKIAQGRRIIGWKLGYTSLAMRHQMKVNEPNYGPLLDNMMLDSGSFISRNLLQPRVEPEIALRFDRKLHISHTFKELLDFIKNAYISLEIVDSIYKDYSFKIEDNTADCSSAAQFVIGPIINHDILEEAKITFLKNGQTVDECIGSAASGHPLNGILWLIKCLEKQNLTIEPEQIIITGGLSSAISIKNGDLIEAITEDSKVVQVYG